MYGLSDLKSSSSNALAHLPTICAGIADCLNGRRTGYSTKPTLVATFEKKVIKLCTCRCLLAVVPSLNLCLCSYIVISCMCMHHGAQHSSMVPSSVLVVHNVVLYWRGGA